jgi:hypothetical protein
MGLSGVDGERVYMFEGSAARRGASERGVSGPGYVKCMCLGRVRHDTDGGRSVKLDGVGLEL